MESERFREVRRVLEKHQDALLALPGVESIGIGYKNNIQTEDHLAIVVTVGRKIPEEQLAVEDVVPKQVEGVATDVVETGAFSIHDKPGG